MNTKCKIHFIKHYPSGWFFTPNMIRALFTSETMQPEWEEEVGGYVREVENSMKEAGGGV